MKVTAYEDTKGCLHKNKTNAIYASKSHTKNTIIKHFKNSLFFDKNFTVPLTAENRDNLVEYLVNNKDIIMKILNDYDKALLEIKERFKE